MNEIYLNRFSILIIEAELFTPGLHMITKSCQNDMKDIYQLAFNLSEKLDEFVQQKINAFYQAGTFP